MLWNVSIRRGLRWSKVKLWPSTNASCSASSLRGWVARAFTAFGSPVLAAFSRIYTIPCPSLLLFSKTAPSLYAWRMHSNHRTNSASSWISWTAAISTTISRSMASSRSKKCCFMLQRYSTNAFQTSIPYLFRDSGNFGPRAHAQPLRSVPRLEAR